MYKIAWYWLADRAEVREVLEHTYHSYWDNEQEYDHYSLPPCYVYKRAVDYSIAEQLWWEHSYE